MVDLADRRALEACRPADPEVVEEARRLKEAAPLDFGLTESAVASWLYTKCHRQIPTTAVDTAVCRPNPSCARTLDEEGRAWITKRALERLIKLHRRGLPLEMATVYLGDGAYAPVPLTALIDRLRGRPVTGLGELARDADAWEARLRRAAGRSDEGGDEGDVVHQILANAELSQLRRHRAVVARLVRHLPPKLRATYLVGASEKHQRFWREVCTGKGR
ncbi:hypothetical protein AQJ64_25490 [Streptomyces griseoruber]|uniref:Uncharacterized protein n=1 Tax=Streptomyces griseoruber TaxID=1943 RepID=A0A101SUH3_9ACTN|nr:hypothetical protein AQJ64_25490 [Streptomyces griseoruber]